MTAIDLEHLRAISLGATIGRVQGWDVFECGGRSMQVQRCDECGLLESDDEAIRLARAAGVQCDDGGHVAPGRRNDTNPGTRKREMTNTTAETNPLLAAAHVAAAEIGGTFDAPLAEDAVQAAFAVLAECWADTIRTGYGNEGPSRDEVKQMILGDLRDTLDALERLVGKVKRQAE